MIGFMRRVVGDLKIWQKFMLIGVLALGMVVLPATLILRSEWAALSVAQEERQGMVPASQIVALIEATQQHRGLSVSVLAGDESARADRQAKQPEVEQALERVMASLQALGGADALVAQGRAIQQEWGDLANAHKAQGLTAAYSFARHGALIEKQLGLLENLSDTTGLALDPESASYHLVITVFGHLPQLTESLGRIRGMGARLLAQGSADPKERAALDGLNDFVKLRAGDAAKAMRLAMAAEPTIKSALEPLITESTSAVQVAMTLANDKIVRPETLDFNPGEYRAALTRALSAQFKLIRVATQSLDAILVARVKSTQREMALVAATIALMAALGGWVSLIVSRTTIDSIDRALNLAQKVAAGDLTSEMRSTSRDEVGQLLGALGSMNDSLVTIVSTVRSSSESIATGSSQIAMGNADLSQRTEEQSSNLQQTAASMEQLSATVKHSADNAHEATQIAAAASDVATRGGDVVGQVVSTMQAISASSNKIADIISVIDGIAFQTNILALNAAVEAARAGEQGRGFAVVAGEVRSLAKRSADAAKEIKALIGDSVEKVDAGSRLVSDAGATMKEIVSQVHKVAHLIGGISTAAAEQTTGISQVGEAVSQLDQVTQQNAALVEESAAAAESLKDQAGRLVNVVRGFKLKEA